jgi:hypothetical protein
MGVSLGAGVAVLSGVSGEAAVDSSTRVGTLGTLAVDAAPPPQAADNTMTDKEAVSNNLIIM